MSGALGVGLLVGSSLGCISIPFLLHAEMHGKDENLFVVVWRCYVSSEVSWHQMLKRSSRAPKGWKMVQKELQSLQGTGFSRRKPFFCTIFSSFFCRSVGRGWWCGLAWSGVYVFFESFHLSHTSHTRWGLVREADIWGWESCYWSDNNHRRRDG